MVQEVIWRLLPLRTDDPYTCMAIDKTIAESVAAGGPPTIRFYRWGGNGAVSYGASQAISDIAVDFCLEQGIPHIRRFTEARAMYHGPTDLTYAIAAPLSVYERRLDIGVATSSKIILSLRQLGIKDAIQAGYTSVLVNGRKISGSVPYFEQRRALFQHGSVFCSLDYERTAKMYGIPTQKLQLTTTSLEEEGCRIESIEEIFQDSFLIGKQWETGEFTEQEQERMNRLRALFSTEEWLSGGEKSRGVCSMNRGVPVPQIIAALIAKP